MTDHHQPDPTTPTTPTTPPLSAERRAEFTETVDQAVRAVLAAPDAAQLLDAFVRGEARVVISRDTFEVVPTPTADELAQLAAAVAKNTAPAPGAFPGNYL